VEILAKGRTPNLSKGSCYRFWQREGNC